ncbi:MAG: hypothetical protein ACRDKZ_01085, partial [Actinomycetota bacterium]
MNPRRDAFERLEGRFEVRVLEPSPPSVHDAPWFADDPLSLEDLPPEREVVLPIETGHLTWNSLCADDPALEAWCRERWLGAWRRLPEPPPNLESTRRALHMLAEHALAPARQSATGKIGLRYTHGGFGTPFFGDDRQVRIEGIELVVQQGGEETRAPLSTLGAARDLIGTDWSQIALYEPTTASSPDEGLTVSSDGAGFVGDLFGFGASVMEQLRTEARPEENPSRVQLWPEHLDVAVEIGDERPAARATFGVSVGDAFHLEPYVYVVPWEKVEPSDIWNAEHFN